MYDISFFFNKFVGPGRTAPVGNPLVVTRGKIFLLLLVSHLLFTHKSISLLFLFHFAVYRNFQVLRQMKISQKREAIIGNILGRHTLVILNLL